MWKPRKSRLDERQNTRAGAGRSVRNLNHEDFLRLAGNSLRAGQYSRAVDNCRLAVSQALLCHEPAAAIQAYEIWIAALFAQNRLADVKKVCCEARSKLGSYPDLIYHEYRAAFLAGNIEVAHKLGREFLRSASGGNVKMHHLTGQTLARVEEVEKELSNQAVPICDYASN